MRWELFKSYCKYRWFEAGVYVCGIATGRTSCCEGQCQLLETVQGKDGMMRSKEDMLRVLNQEHCYDEANVVIAETLIDIRDALVRGQKEKVVYEVKKEGKEETEQWEREKRKPLDGDVMEDGDIYKEHCNCSHCVKYRGGPPA